jgi:DNA-binding winged helix-turn-helix (wHTH) protein
MNKVASPSIRFGPFAFDAATGEVTRNSRPIALRPQSVRILQYLLAHPGQLATREELQGELWAAGTFVDFEHGLNLCIHEIRAALHDDATRPRYIETLPRRGYRFIATIDDGVTTPPAAPIETARQRADHPVELLMSLSPAHRSFAIAAFLAVVAAIVIFSAY